MASAGKAAISGWGETYATDDDPQTPLELASGAISEALDHVRRVDDVPWFTVRG